MPVPLIQLPDDKRIEVIARVCFVACAAFGDSCKNYETRKQPKWCRLKKSVKESWIRDIKCLIEKRDVDGKFAGFLYQISNAIVNEFVR